MWHPGEQQYTQGSGRCLLPAACCVVLHIWCSAEFKHYWVGNSSIPGAGLGVFARTDMPAGTIWNFEDAQPDKTLVLALYVLQYFSSVQNTRIC
jgi:hypothetical protein